jgi:hypothetical protein
MLRLGEEIVIIPGPMWIEVSKSSFFLVVFLEKGLYLRSYEVGLGKDDKTPMGLFTIETRLVKPDWYYNGRRVPFGDPKNVLGTRWMGFENRPGITGGRTLGGRTKRTFSRRSSSSGHGRRIGARPEPWRRIDSSRQSRHNRAEEKGLKGVGIRVSGISLFLRRSPAVAMF